MTDENTTSEPFTEPVPEPLMGSATAAPSAPMAPAAAKAAVAADVVPAQHAREDVTEGNGADEVGGEDDYQIPDDASPGAPGRR